MQKAGDDFTPQVGRGQRGDQRLPETVETHVSRAHNPAPTVHAQPAHVVPNLPPVLARLVARRRIVPAQRVPSVR